MYKFMIIIGVEPKITQYEHTLATNMRYTIDGGHAIGRGPQTLRSG